MGDSKDQPAVSRALEHGRPVLAVLFTLWIILLAATWPRSGDDPWSALGVPTLKPGFVDARLVTAAWECDRLGYEVLFENPCADGERASVLPRIWLWLSPLGFDSGDAWVLGSLFVLVFVVGVFVVIGPIPLWQVIPYAAVLGSPVVALGMERGNTDLLIFGIVAAFVVLLSSTSLARQRLSLIPLVVGGMIKFYPVVATVALLRSPSPTRNRGAVLAAVLLASYFCVIRSDLRQIARTTMTEALANAYGIGVSLEHFRRHLDTKTPELSAWISAHHGVSIAIVSLVGALIAISFAVFMAKSSRGMESEETDRSMNSFWVGGAIYMGTYVLWNNYSYRLIFLVLTIPQILIWIRSANRARRVASSLALVSVIGACWLETLSFSFFRGISMFAEPLAGYLFVFYGGMLLQDAWSKWTAYRRHSPSTPLSS